MSYAPEAGLMRNTSPSRVVHQSMSSGPHVNSHGMFTPDTRVYSFNTVSSSVHVGCAKPVRHAVNATVIEARCAWRCFMNLFVIEQ